MKIKSKISLGLYIQFILILAICAFSLIYIHKISIEAEGIIKDNYRSLEFVTNMSNSLIVLQNKKADSVNYKAGIVKFNYYLDAQENNITEPGEQQLVLKVKKVFESLKNQSYTSESVFCQIQNCLNRIHKLNMRAIYDKNIEAKAVSGRISTIMAAITALSLVIMILFYLYFPSYISFAFMTISERMKDIAAGHYEQKLNLKSGDEFEEISKSFDAIVEKLIKK